MGAFLLGFAIGAVYQVCRIRRAAFAEISIPRWIAVIWLNLEDFFFLLAVGCAVTILFYALSGGVVRLMVFPAMGLGLLTWRKTLGRLIDGVTRQILRLLSWIFHWIVAKVVRPIGNRVRSTLQGILRWVEAKRKRAWEKRMWKQAEKETLRDGVWLEQVLFQEGMLPLGKTKVKKKDR